VGYDFSLFWEIGKHFLEGGDPYSLSLSFYPPAAVYFFVLFSLLPLKMAIAVFTGINSVVFVATAKKLDKERWWAWILFPPVMFVIFVGQLDLIFLYLSTFLVNGGIIAALAGSLLTLKPQMAFIALPWFLIKWAKNDKSTLAKWIVFTTILHTVPLVINPGLYKGWLNNAQGAVSWRMQQSPGVFSLTNLNVPVAFLVIVALITAGWALFKDYKTSKIAQLMALPVGIWYDSVFVIGTAPYYIMVPVGIVSFVLAYFVSNSLPLFSISLIAILWRITKRSRNMTSSS
jgi:hypothetical protein